MKPLPRPPGARPRNGSDHSYLPDQQHQRKEASLWMPIVLALLLLAIGVWVWVSL